MNQPRQNHTVTRSDKIYRRLLWLYPQSHRRAYGQPMAQLFHDQCIVAWGQRRWPGVVSLWFRVLPDLIITSLREHLLNLKGTRTMSEKIADLVSRHSTPTQVFVRVFAVVFLLILLTCVVVTFILPNSYASTARIKIENHATADKVESYDPYFIQTEFEVIQSEVILSKVIEELDLNTVWGKKYADGEKLKTSETVGLLKARMDLRPIRSTSLIDIRVFSDDPAEASRLANGITEAYRSYREGNARRNAAQVSKNRETELRTAEKKAAEAEAIVARVRKDLNIPTPEPSPAELQASYPPYWSAKLEAAEANRMFESLKLVKIGESDSTFSPELEVVERAVPGLRPVRPNKPLNIVLGIVVGSVLAAGAGLLAAVIAMMVRSKATRQAAIT